MPGRSVRIARIAGIPVGISPWWLAIVALLTWSLGRYYFPEEVHGISAPASYALGLASVLLLFASILAHEFGHAIVARRRGIEVQEIDLWLLGGVSRMRGEAHRPGDELRYALAGPAVTAVLAGIFWALVVTLPSSTPAVVAALVEYQALVNSLLLGFNLLPAFPLDGGRVLRSLLWRRSGQLGRATERAAAIGRGFGFLLGALGVLELIAGAPEGLWLAVVGYFIVVAARAQEAGAQARTLLAGVSARELMSSPALCLFASDSAARAADIPADRRPKVIVVIDERSRALGLLGLARVERLSRSDRLRMHLGELAERDDSLMIGPDERAAELLEREAFVRLGHAVVVDDRGEPLGVISIGDVERAVRAARRGGGQAGAGRSPGGGQRTVAC